MGVDVLITGNSHAVEVWQSNDGGIFVSPGSVSEKALVDLSLIPKTFWQHPCVLPSSPSSKLTSLLFRIGHWVIYDCGLYGQSTQLCLDGCSRQQSRHIQLCT